jgi:hypothetical protein
MLLSIELLKVLTPSLTDVSEVRLWTPVSGYKSSGVTKPLANVPG